MPLSFAEPAPPPPQQRWTAPRVFVWTLLLASVGFWFWAQLTA